MEDRDEYQILGVPSDASPDDIRRAFQKQCLNNHPDKNSGSDEFVHIHRSYKILSDPVTREFYDKYGRAGIQQVEKYGESLPSYDSVEGLRSHLVEKMATHREIQIQNVFQPKQHCVVSSAVILPEPQELSEFLQETQWQCLNANFRNELTWFRWKYLRFSSFSVCNFSSKKSACNLGAQISSTWEQSLATFRFSLNPLAPCIRSLTAALNVSTSKDKHLMQGTLQFPPNQQSFFRYKYSWSESTSCTAEVGAYVRARTILPFSAVSLSRKTPHKIKLRGELHRDAYEVSLKYTVFSLLSWNLTCVCSCFFGNLRSAGLELSYELLSTLRVSSSVSLSLVKEGFYFRLPISFYSSRYSNGNFEVLRDVPCVSLAYLVWHLPLLSAYYLDKLGGFSLLAHPKPAETE